MDDAEQQHRSLKEQQFEPASEMQVEEDGDTVIREPVEGTNLQLTEQKAGGETASLSDF